MSERAPTPRVFPTPDELTVVIRAAGERTESACHAAMIRGLPDPAQCVLIRERPFSRAVRATLEIGRDARRPWLMAVDADILPLGDILHRVREICGKMAPDAYCATPLFLCNAIGGLATRGLHCYRASLLDEALSVEPNPDEPFRPESAIQDAMRQRGYGRECYAKVFGLHEFEQSYTHIYLKALLRGRKEPELGAIMDRLRAAVPEHPDARVALWGLEDAKDEAGKPVEYDWDAPRPALEARMRAYGMCEKPPFAPADLDSFVRQRIAAHDFRRDTTTLAWIRELLRFDLGAPEALAYVEHPPLGAGTGTGG